jgi:hypothetical protein
MKHDRSSILGRFRGKYAMLPLLGLAVGIFVGLGGYKPIADFASREVTGFLAGTATGKDSPAAAQTAQPKPPTTSTEKAAAPALVAPAPATSAPAAAAAASQAPVSAPDTVVVAEMGYQEGGGVRQKVKAYTAAFLRDPFYSLIQIGKDRPAKLLEVGQAKMVGSVWGESGIIALLEDDSGRSFALRVGDSVVNGRVILVTPASVTFSITTFDLTKNITLELAEEGE